MNPVCDPLPSVDGPSLGDRRLPSEPTLPAREELSLAAALSELTKARLTFMVLLTTLAGYGFASHGVFDWTKLVHTILGTTLVAICSSILNQALERHTDALMPRTQDRPFVTHRLPLRETILAGMILGAIGLAELALFVSAPTMLLAFLTLFVYVLVYTPLKRVTSLNTLVGTIPGALPPLMGATAAAGHFTVEGWTLFTILAFWQLPHFYAIAWLYKDEYQAAGLRMVSVNDPHGTRTGLHALTSAMILLPVSLLPSWIGHSGLFYGIVAGLLSLVFLAASFYFALAPDRRRARILFFTSIIYLPLILAALAIDIPIQRFCSSGP